MSFSSIPVRLRHLLRFARTARSPLQIPAMCILGLARGNPFSGDGAISRMGRQCVPSVTVLPGALKGGKVSLSPCDLGHLVSYEEIIVDHGYDMDRVPFAPDVIIDCGAHIGLFTLLAAVAFPAAKLMAFEPSPANLVWLKDNLRSNKIDCDLREMAVGDHDGTMHFQMGASNSGRIVEDNNISNQNQIEVGVACLSSIIAGMKVESLLLKLDIEGAEAMVLPSIIPVLPAKCSIFFETHAGSKGWSDASHWLSQAGFHVEQLRGRGEFYDGYALRNP